MRADITSPPATDEGALCRSSPPTFVKQQCPCPVTYTRHRHAPTCTLQPALSAVSGGDALAPSDPIIGPALPLWVQQRTAAAYCKQQLLLHVQSYCIACTLSSPDGTPKDPKHTHAHPRTSECSHSSGCAAKPICEQLPHAASDDPNIEPQSARTKHCTRTTHTFHAYLLTPPCQPKLKPGKNGAALAGYTYTQQATCSMHAALIVSECRTALQGRSSHLAPDRVNSAATTHTNNAPRQMLYCFHLHQTPAPSRTSVHLSQTGRLKFDLAHLRHQAYSTQLHQPTLPNCIRQQGCLTCFKASQNASQSVTRAMRCCT
jgi:hypothetical protein